MRSIVTRIAIGSGLTFIFGCTISASAIGATEPLDDAALRAYAARPYDKAAMMNSTIELGRYRGVPVVAEFHCADVCPQYTMRIIHFQLPADADCASVGGVEQTVLVPVAITVMPKIFCIPQPLVEPSHYPSR